MSKRSPAKQAMDRAFRVWKLTETASQSAWRNYQHARQEYLGKRQAMLERKRGEQSS